MNSTKIKQFQAALWKSNTHEVNLLYVIFQFIIIQFALA